jgi:hypothetical protein
VPQVRDRAMPEKPTGKVSTLREFLRIFIELMKDEIALNILYKMIDHCMKVREAPIAQRVVN